MNTDQFKSAPSNLVSLGVITLLVLLTHFPLLFPGQIINPDAQYIFPILESVTGPLDYLAKLSHYETLDFQPVRDLSLFVDLLVYRETGVVISVFLNCLFWIGGCFLVWRLIQETIKDDGRSLLLTLSFAVYPIFGQALNWGIARKHILAFFFTTWATLFLFRWVKEQRGEFKICLLYTLSVLSLPVSMLWPLWAMFYVYVYHPELKARFKKPAIFLCTLALLLIYINWSYYKTSLTFLEIYSKKENSLNLLAIFVALGHYTKQFLFPYQLAFSYTYDNLSVAGLGVFFVLAAVFLLRKNKEKREWIWVAFSAVHLMVLLSSPRIYFDTYVLLPGLGVLMLLALLTRNWQPRRFHWLVIPILIWGGFSLRDSFPWKEKSSYYENNYKRDQNCTSAMSYAVNLYFLDRPIPPELYAFIQENSCTQLQKDMTQNSMIWTMTFEAIQLLKENEIDLDYRLSRLQELGSKNYIPMLIYACLLAELDRENELEEVMRNLNRSFRGNDMVIGYHPIYSEILPAYCQENQLRECLEFTKRFLPKQKEPFL